MVQPGPAPDPLFFSFQQALAGRYSIDRELGRVGVHRPAGGPVVRRWPSGSRFEKKGGSFTWLGRSRVTRVETKKPRFPYGIPIESLLPLGQEAPR